MHTVAQGRSQFAQHYDSAQGITNKEAYFIIGIGAVVIGFITIRVWLSIKKDKEK